MDTRAIIYLSPGHLDPDRAGARCLAYCEALGYEVVALVVDDATASRWRDGVITMLANGEADVVVVPDHRALPARRTPRLESVADRPRPHLGGGPGRRRVRPSPVER